MATRTNIETPVKSSYRPKWGVWEGLREIVQNALDARDAGNEMDIAYDSNVLTVTSKGVTLPREALLLGHSHKPAGSRGRHGDGLKIGCLALAREGLKVTIRTGIETWTPKVKTSTNYNADVMAWTIVTTPDVSDDLVITIKGVTPETWEMLRGRIVDLQPDLKPTIESHVGSVFVKKDINGQVFCKGIYVCTESRLAHGYNFNNLELDVDRSVPSDFDLSLKAAQLAATLLADADTAHAVFDHILSGQKDVEDLQYVINYDAKAKAALAAMFHERYGASAVPSAAEYEDQLKLAGFTPVIMSGRQLGVFRMILGYESENIEKGRADYDEMPRSEIPDRDMANLLRATLALGKAVSPSLLSSDIMVVRNNGAVSVAPDGRLAIPRNHLRTASDALLALASFIAPKCKPIQSTETLLAGAALGEHTATFALEVVKLDVTMAPVEADAAPVEADGIPF